MAESATIESLQIQVEASANSAQQSINKLKNALNQLRSACSKGAGLASYIEQLTQLKETTDKLGTSSAESLSKLATSLRELKSVGKLNLGETVSQLDKASTAAEKTASHTGSIGKRLLTTVASLKVAGTAIARLIDKSNTYVEDLNLFNASLGEYAQSAQEYAESVSSLMGIDPAAWMRNQGIFMTLAKGFGVTSDRAYIMSKNLTQLGYDLSSFFNIASNSGQGSAMQKLQAAISGELEPLRRLGYDLSEARLKAMALSLGIDQTFNSMTQAQKAQLRYYAIMTQVTTAQGDMARTLNAPANQLRVLKAQAEQAGRALGNIFIPALNAILPYAIAAANAIQQVANAIANVFGFSLPEIDYSGLSGAADAAGTLDDSLESASGSAKKLNELLADWDELNIIQSKSGGGGGGSASLYNAADWTFDLPEYDFLKDLAKSRVGEILESWKPTINWIKDNIESILGIAGAIGSSVAMWSLSKRFLPNLSRASAYLDHISGVAAGLITAAASIVLNITFTTNWLQEGNWGSLLGETITSFAGSSILASIIRHVVTGEKGTVMADYAAGTLLTINGGIGIVMSLKDVVMNGFNYKNILRLITGGVETGVGFARIAKQVAAALSGNKLALGAQQMAGIAGATVVATMGVALSVYLMEDAKKQESTFYQSGEVALSAVTDALTAAFAGYTITKTTGNAAAGWAVFGVTLGLNAAISTVSLYNDVKANGLTGSAFQVSTAIKTALEAAATGWSIGMTFGHPVAGGLVGAAIGLAVTAAATIVGLVNKTTASDMASAEITYGDNALTESEIQEFINSKFSYDVTAQVESITAVVNDKTDINKALSGDLTTLESELNSLKLGLDPNSYEYILSLITGEGGTISKLNEQLESESNAIKMWLTIGDIETKKNVGLVDSFETILAADSMISAELTWAGEQFADLITKGMKEELSEQEAEMRDALLDFLTNVTQAAVKGRAEGEFKVGIANLKLKDLTEGSVNQALAQYKVMEDELRTTLKNLQDETLIGYYSKLSYSKAMVEGYSERHPGEEVPQELLDTITQLEQAIKTLEKQIEEGSLQGDLDVMTADARKALYDEFIELLGTEDLRKYLYEEFQDLGYELSGKNLSNAELFNLALDTENRNNAYAGWLVDALDDYMKGNLKETQDFMDSIGMGEDFKNWFREFAASSLDDQVTHNALVDANEATQAVAAFYESLDTYKEYMTDTAYNTLKTYIDTLSGYDPESDLYGSLHDYLAAVFEGWNLKTSGKTTEFLAGQDQRSELLAQYKELLAEAESWTPFEHVGADFSNAMTTVSSEWNTTIQGMNQNNSVQIKITPKLVGFNFKWPEIVMRAGGGMPDMGELFVAREAGPEMVGRIGRNTAVANNDQIEAGISSGVREANAEQNDLLRQQNQYLRILISKSGNVKLEPSTALARTVKRSNELMHAADGV